MCIRDRVTQEAAKLFSRLAERLELEERSLGATRAEIAHFLMRLLFCLFADSIGLLPDHVFRNLLQSDDRFRPRQFLRKLKLLFEAMSEPDGIFGEHTIRYFNGGLFDTASIIQLDLAAVSYTHLDVYKRQVERRWAIRTLVRPSTIRSNAPRMRSSVSVSTLEVASSRMRMRGL